MTNIERKALALVNEIEREEGVSDITPKIMRGLIMDEALCRAIERHEAFRQEVSDVVEHFKRCYPGYQHASLFDRFIIAKPDPLVEAWDETWAEPSDKPARLETFRAALAKRGGRIVFDDE